MMVGSVFSGTNSDMWLLVSVPVQDGYGRDQDAWMRGSLCHGPRW